MEVMKARKTISGGLYLVADPALPGLTDRVKLALDGGVDVLQIWDHWNGVAEPSRIIDRLMDCAAAYAVPVLINNDFELLKKHGMHGIHVDSVEAFRRGAAPITHRDFLLGVTLGNDPQSNREALSIGPDYASFCSIFPSTSATTCVLVEPEAVESVKRATSIPIFGSGGITPANVHLCLDMGFDGVAVISGILGHDDPHWATRQYKHAIDFHQRYAH